MSVLLLAIKVSSTRWGGWKTSYLEFFVEVFSMRFHYFYGFSYLAEKKTTPDVLGESKSWSDFAFAFLGRFPAKGTKLSRKGSGLVPSVHSPVLNKVFYNRNGCPISSILLSFSTCICLGSPGSFWPRYDDAQVLPFIACASECGASEGKRSHFVIVTKGSAF